MTLLIFGLKNNLFVSNTLNYCNLGFKVFCISFNLIDIFLQNNFSIQVVLFVLLSINLIYYLSGFHIVFNPLILILRKITNCLGKIDAL